MAIKYEKPTVAVERYALCQSIAACTTKIGFKDSECVYNDPDSTRQAKNLASAGWFLSGSCENNAIILDNTDSICYHTNTNAMFNS